MAKAIAPAELLISGGATGGFSPGRTLEPVVGTAEDALDADGVELVAVPCVEVFGAVDEPVVADPTGALEE